MVNTLLLHFPKIFQVWVLRTQGYFLLERLLPSRNMGQKTDAKRLQQKWPHCSTNNLASKGSCEAQDIGQMHLTGLQDFLFKFSVTVRGIFSPPLSPHLTWTKKMSYERARPQTSGTRCSKSHFLARLNTELYYLLFLEGSIFKLFPRQ